MNLIKKLLGKKEITGESISFDKLPEWLEYREQKISDKIDKDASSIYPEIERTLNKIKNSTIELENANPEGRFHLKMVKIASSNRDNMTKQVRMLIENIIIPKQKGIKSIAAFHESATQMLEICLENMMKSYQYTKLVYFEESKNVVAEVNSLGRLLNNLIEPINTNKQVIDALDQAHELVQHIRTITTNLESNERSIQINEERIVSLTAQIQEKQQLLKDLHQSEEFLQYSGSRDDLIFLEKNAENKRCEIHDIISPLNKALNRLKQLSDSGRYTLKPEDREMLNMCFSCPVDVPQEFFIDFKKIIESGVLNLQKTEKLLSQTRFAASAIGEKRKEYQDILRDINLKKDEISKMKILDEEKHLNDTLSALSDRLMIAKKELDSSRRQLVSQQDEISSKKLKLQEYVSVIHHKAIISWNAKVYVL